MCRYSLHLSCPFPAAARQPLRARQATTTPPTLNTAEAEADRPLHFTHRAPTAAGHPTSHQQPTNHTVQRATPVSTLDDCHATQAAAAALRQLVVRSRSLRPGSRLPQSAAVASPLPASSLPPSLPLCWLFESACPYVASLPVVFARALCLTSTSAAATAVVCTLTLSS